MAAEEKKKMKVQRKKIKDEEKNFIINFWFIKSIFSPSSFLGLNLKNKIYYEKTQDFVG